jgi:hypothetical protein
VSTPLLSYIAQVIWRIAENQLTKSGKLMSQLVSGPANARFFGLDMGGWSVLLGGSTLAALVLFLN